MHDDELGETLISDFSHKKQQYRSSLIISKITTTAFSGHHPPCAPDLIYSFSKFCLDPAEGAGDQGFQISADRLARFQRPGSLALAQGVPCSHENPEAD